MTDSRMRREMIYDAAKKSVLLAYILWFFLGTIGAHRFYLGYTFSGLIMLVLFIFSSILTWVLIGYAGLALVGLWWIVDALLIPGMAARKNLELISRLT